MLRVLAALAAVFAVVSLGAASNFEEEEDEVSLLQQTLESHLGNASRMNSMNSTERHGPGLELTSGGSGTGGATAPVIAPAPAPSVLDTFSMRNVVAEYVAMTLFVTIGCGAAMAIAKEEGSAWVLQVALAFGFAITALAYSLGRYSGGQINCAVTLALWVHGDLSWFQALFNFIAQMLGSVTGAIFLCIVFPKDKDRTGALGSNGIAEGYRTFGVLVGEFLMTFLLVLVVFESGQVAGPASGIAVICIGLAVFLAHCVLIPLDGCSINPTRSFGPALLATLRNGKADTFKDMWVFWIGPCLGALAATGTYALFQT